MCLVIYMCIVWCVVHVYIVSIVWFHVTSKVCCMFIDVWKYLYSIAFSMGCSMCIYMVCVCSVCSMCIIWFVLYS